MNEILLNIKMILKNFYNQKNFLYKGMTAFIVYFLGIFSILKAYIYYQDDIARISDPERWPLERGGEIFNWAWTRFLSFSDIPQDISPLSHLIGIFFLTLASLILVQVICHKLEYKYIIFSTIIGLSPYFLQNMSYRFGVVPYTFSVLCAIFPFLFYKNLNTFLWVSFVSLTLVFFQYPPTLGVYLVVLLYLWMSDFFKENHKLKVLYKGGVFIVLISITFLLTMEIIKALGEYDLISQRFEFCSLETCYQVFEKNVSVLIRLWIQQWINTPLGLLFLCLFVFFSFQVFLKALEEGNKSSKLWNVGIAGISIPLMFLAVPIAIVFLEKTPLYPRFFVGYGVLITVMGLSLMNINLQKLRKIFVVFNLLLFWGVFVFAVHYGNLLIAQKYYETYRLQSALADLESYPYKRIRFSGPPIQNPVVVEKSKEYPFYSWLITGSQKQGFFEKRISSLMVPYLDKCLNETVYSQDILLDTPAHRFILINENCVEIQLKPDPQRDVNQRF